MSDKNTDPVASFDRGRPAALQIGAEEFRTIGHKLINDTADFLHGLHDRPVTRAASPASVRDKLGWGTLPSDGTDVGKLLDDTASLLRDESLLSSHPLFLGYIIGAASPAGMLADLLADSVNANVGSAILAPVATEIENQTVRWIAELIGYPNDCGGILVSGGNMANFVGFLTARRMKLGADVRKTGLREHGGRLAVYCSAETHTWIQKAADLFGLGTDAVRWIETDAQRRMRLDVLENHIAADRAAGITPLMVVGTAGSVSTGAIDQLPGISSLCNDNDCWFHVDGAYGAPAAALPESPVELKALALADSVALDPHKWLYAPLEAGCALVRRPSYLIDTFGYKPPYYHFSDDGDEAVNFYERGMQNSRGFRALKVWLSLKQAGRSGYEQMIREDIRLAHLLYELCDKHAELQAVSVGLSITTFRYIPVGASPGTAEGNAYLDTLNVALLEAIQSGGDAFVSNAVVGGRQVLRTCIVNFRTTEGDIRRLVDIVVEAGRKVAKSHPLSEQLMAGERR